MKTIYKTELHCHTKESSSCAKVEANRLVQLYQKAGYQTIVITDHCSKSKMECFKNVSWKEKVEYILQGYKQAELEARNVGMTVLLGCEITLTITDSDYLVWGIEENFLQEHEKIYDYTLANLHRLCEEKGYLLVQAHPFRDEIELAPLEEIDGIEVFNGCHDEISRNEKAWDYGRKTNKILTSGSDFHAEADLARGGIITKEPIQNNTQLLKILKEEKFERIVDGEI